MIFIWKARSCHTTPQNIYFMSFNGPHKLFPIKIKSPIQYVQLPKKVQVDIFLLLWTWWQLNYYSINKNFTSFSPTWKFESHLSQCVLNWEKIKRNTFLFFGKNLFSCSFPGINLTNYKERSLQKLYAFSKHQFYIKATSETIQTLKSLIPTGNVISALGEI